MNPKDEMALPVLVVLETMDGRVFAGETKDAALRLLWRSYDHVPTRTLVEWMRWMQGRAFAWNKQPVRVSSVDEFVDDLVAASMLRLRFAH